MQEVAAFLETALRPSCKVLSSCSVLRVTVEGPGLMRYYAKDTMNYPEDILFDLTRMDPARVTATNARQASEILFQSRSGDKAIKDTGRATEGLYFEVAPDATRQSVIMGFVYAIELAQGAPTAEAESNIRAAMGTLDATSAGPTMAQTVLWLKAHVPVHDEGQDIDASRITTQNAWLENRGKIVEWAEIPPGNITGLVADNCTLREVHVRCVRLTGKAFRACPMEKGRDCRDITQAHLFLGENTTQEEVDKFIKALKRLAELNGAVLPKDDLF
jgi:hypothetical protein